MPEQPEQLRFRRQVDALGFAMLYHVVTLDKELSDGAFRLYALLLKYARQAGGCWPGIERLAGDLGVSEPTVKRRVAELVKRGLITRERRYMRSSITWLEDLEAIYGLQLKNDTFEQPFEQLKNDTTVQLKNDTTEEQTDKNKHVVVVVDLSAEQQDALEALTSLGVDPGTVRILARECDPGDVVGWVAYARKAQGLDNAAGLVVARLRAGAPAPPPGGDGDRDQSDRRRFIEGEYAEYVQH